MKRRECGRHRRRWLALALTGALLLGGLTTGAQAQEPVNITLNSVDASDFPRVTAYATVSDATGHTILGLAETAFTLDEDGTPIEDFEVKLRDDVGEPILLALVLDTSGSMDGQALADTQAAAVQLIDDLGSADEVAMLSFATEVTTHVEFTTDKGAAIAAVEALEAEGGTALNEAIYQAITMLARRPQGRKALVVLTDGQNTDSAITIEDAIGAAQDASVPVYTLGFGPSIQPDILERVALLTGGHFYQSPSSEEIGESFVAVAELLRTQYVFRFTSSLQADDGQHTLHVEVDAEGIPADAEARFTAERREVIVEMLSPGEGEEIGGLVNLQPRIEAPGDVVEVAYLLDGDELATVTTEVFSHDWDTAGVPLGEHTLTVHATDSAGNEGRIDLVVTVVEPVVLTFVAPPQEDLQNLSGEVIVEVVVEALYGLARIDFAVDSEIVETVETPPYRFTWNTAGWATGSHTLTATAHDVNGLSDEASLDVWVAFRGTNYGLWVALGLLLLVGGVILPLAVRKRRRMQVRPATPAGPVAPSRPIPGARPAREAGPPAAWLVVEQGPEVGRRWPVPPGETSLGRSRADNAIVIPSRTASRRHAVIRADAAGCVYYDLQPTNPTLVNDKPIVGSHQLAEGDRIRIGDVVLKFSEEEKK
jgi:Ca-activated chloride channel family protein